MMSRIWLGCGRERGGAQDKGDEAVSAASWKSLGVLMIRYHSAVLSGALLPPW